MLFAVADVVVVVVVVVVVMIVCNKRPHKINSLTLFCLSASLFGKQDWVRTEYQTEVRSLSTSLRITELGTLVVLFMQNIDSVTLIHYQVKNTNETLL